MRRQLKFDGFETVCVEPHVAGFAPIEDIKGADVVVLMTPHRHFGDLNALTDMVGNPNCWFVDIWGFWSAMRHRSDNGFFQAKEV
jgi:hypothetical protein